MRTVLRLLMGSSVPAAFPASLFANGEKGWCLLPGTEFAATFQERTGASATTPAGNGDPVGTFHDLVTGLYFSPSADARRAIYTVASGKTYLDYDGSDDCMVGPTVNFTGTDKITLITALECDTGTATQVITELSANYNSNNGAFLLMTRTAFDGDLGWGVKGDSTARFRRTATAALPRKALSTCVFDIAGATTDDEIKPRVDGAVPTLTTSNNAGAGAGNFGSYVPYIGARGNASLRFNGRVWGEICIGRALSEGEITQAQTYLAGLAGITL